MNPERKRWDVVNLDTVRFTGADSLRQSGTFRARRYRKVPNLVNVHSWMPVAFNPFDAVDEHNINLNLGVTLLSQNLLSNTELMPPTAGTATKGRSSTSACVTSGWACTSTWTHRTAATSFSIRWCRTIRRRAIPFTRSVPVPTNTTP